MIESPTPTPAGVTEAAKPTLKDRATDWLNKGKDMGSKALGYAGRGAEEVSVATGVTPLVREAAGALTPAVNTGAELAVAAGKGIDRGVSHVGNALKAGVDRLGIGWDYLQKYGALKPFGARVLEKGQAALDKVLEKPADWVGDAYSYVDTFIDEKVAPVLENIGTIASAISPETREEQEARRKKKEAAKAEKAKIRAEKTAERKDKKEIDPRVEAASKVVEGSELIAMVSEGREAAIKFDSLDDVNGIVMAEKILQGGLTGENKDKAAEVSALKKQVMEARGETPNKSFDHEARLSEKAEENEVKAIELGIDVLDLLPDSAEDLDRSTLNQARAKAIALARVNRGIIRNLTSIAKSLEARFPDKADEVRTKLVALTEPLREKNGVADAIHAGVDGSQFMRKASGDVYTGLIKNSNVFSELTKSQQDEVTAALGATRKEGITGRNKYERYDAEAGSTYDTALQSYAEYAKATVAYEAMREQVDENPELACQLVVAAERVVQAKFALKLASSKLSAELLIKSKQVRDAESNKTYATSHTVEEQAERNQRKEYYAKILDRQKARIDREAPTVKKINQLIMIAGGATAAAIAGVEGIQGAVQIAPEMMALLKQAYNLVKTIDYPVAIDALKVGATVWAGSELAKWLGKKVGPRVENKSTEVKTEAAADIAANIDQLTRLVGELSDDNPAKAQFQEVLKNMSKS